MSGYKVQYIELGRWVTDDVAYGVNLLYAECIANYHKERGRVVRIVKMEED